MVVGCALKVSCRYFIVLPQIKPFGPLSLEGVLALK